MRLPKTTIMVLTRDGWIIFISGKKESGKTDFALKLAQYCYEILGRVKIATNIKTESYMIEKQITNLPDLEQWLKEKGKKVFILDETGKHIGRTQFMTRQTKLLFDILQLIRHYDCGFIGIAPSNSFVNKNFTNTDLLDLWIKKLSKHKAKIKNYLIRSKQWKITNIDKTSIWFDSKDIAEFTIRKNIALASLPLCCQVAKLYVEKGTYKQIKNILGLAPEQIKRELHKHIEHTLITNHIEQSGKHIQQKPATTLKAS